MNQSEQSPTKPEEQPQSAPAPPPDPPPHHYGDPDEHQAEVIDLPQMVEL